jgi:hypothetical protein
MLGIESAANIATATSSSRSRRRSSLVPPDPITCPIAQLVRQAGLASAEFRLHGCETKVSNTGRLAACRT